MTHYETLAVSQNAPAEVIAAAWKALARVYHPDKNPGNKRAAQMMTRVNAAYEVLKDPEKRTAYDQTLQTERVERTARSAPASKHNRAQRGPQPHEMYVEYQSTGNDGLDYLMMQMQGAAVTVGVEMLNHLAQQNPMLEQILRAAKKRR